MSAARRVCLAAVRRRLDVECAGACPSSVALILISAVAAVSAAAGWIVGWIVCARTLGGRAAALERDGLTGLWRREGFTQRAPGALAAGNAIALLDVNGFKHVNDTAGHAAGDEVLRAVADRLVAELGESALIARLGGDEFAVITTLDVAGVGERLCELSAALSAAVVVPGVGELAVGVSLGMAWLRDLPAFDTEFAAEFDSGPTPRARWRRGCTTRTEALWTEALWSAVLAEGLGAADAAMYAAKAAGQGWRLFDREVDPVRPAAHIGAGAPRRYREHGCAAPDTATPGAARERGTG